MGSVLCVRCLKVYMPEEQPLTKNKTHPCIKERKCPHCGCTVYYSK